MIYSRILIAVDGSEYSTKAARRGLELAVQLKAIVALLSVVEKPLGTDAATSQQITKTRTQDTERRLNRLKEFYSGKERNLTLYIPEGNPKEEIIKVAETWGADLIIIGTHGKSGLRDLLLGSIAETIVGRSTVPVMVVPSKLYTELLHVI